MHQLHQGFGNYRFLICSFRMSKSGKILKDFFIFIIPISILLHLLTLGHWTVEFKFEGNKYTTEAVNGFPLPSNGFFPPMIYPSSSGASCISWTNFTTNVLITIFTGALLYYFLLRKIILPKLNYLFIFIPIYWIGLILFCSFVFLSEVDPWFNDFKIISYHFWSF